VLLVVDPAEAVGHRFNPTLLGDCKPLEALDLPARVRVELQEVVPDGTRVDLDDLDYSRLEDGEAFLVEVTTPFVLESEYPSAADQDVPWWWKESRHDLREREEKILEQREVYRLQTVDHGQVVKYEGDRPVETAKSGILRAGTHSKYGFGELRVKPVDPRPDQCKNSEKNAKTTE